MQVKEWRRKVKVAAKKESESERQGTGNLVKSESNGKERKWVRVTRKEWASKWKVRVPGVEIHESKQEQGKSWTWTMSEEKKKKPTQRTIKILLIKVNGNCASPMNNPIELIYYLLYYYGSV